MDQDRQKLSPSSLSLLLFVDLLAIIPFSPIEAAQEQERRVDREVNGKSRRDGGKEEIERVQTVMVIRCNYTPLCADFE